MLTKFSCWELNGLPFNSLSLEWTSDFGRCLSFFSALFQMKEAKRLKEFLEDYDDERDDPKFYRFFFVFFLYTL